MLEGPAQGQGSGELEGDPKASKGTAPLATGLANTVRTEPAAKPDKPDRTDNPATVQTASAGGIAKQQPLVAQGAPKCRVWTASYGGQKAILIRVQSEGAVNYTVLDVNDGAEKREADAYIAAYARGGTIAGEFASPNQALDKAFELCPES
jgi:hypothetical protein